MTTIEPPAVPLPVSNARIVVPPPEIKTIVEKTAQFVAKHGQQAEARIAQSQKSNTKFSFLTSTDPYNAYYLQRVKAHREGTADAQEEPKADETAKDDTSQAKSGVLEKAAETKKKEEKAVTLEPPTPEQFTINFPRDVSPLIMDIMKLTAIFVARNGDQFKIDLQSRERGADSQFGFLDTQHAHHPLFESLVNSYRKVMNAPESLVSQIKTDAAEKAAVLKRVSNKSAWEKKKAAEEKARGDAEEREKEIIANIDWKEFIIVETIDFDDSEELSVPEPHPLSKKTAQEPLADVEMDTDEVHDEVPEQEMKIVSDYKFNPSKKTDPSKLRVQICPNCSQSIPIDEMEEHLRIELLDPKWRAQQQIAQEKKGKELSADDTEITKRLSQIAGKRPDIFGSTKEEMERISQEDRPKKQDETIWDGHSDSIARTANAALSVDLQERAKRGPVIEEVPKGPNIGPTPASANRPGLPTPSPMQPRPPVSNQPMSNPIMRPQYPLMPPMGHHMPMHPPGMMPFGVPGMPFPHMPGMPGMPGMPMPGMPGMPAMPMPPSNPAPSIDLAPQPAGDDEQAGKRQKVESSLVPESDWIQQYPGPVTVSIQVPSDPEKSEWQLNGQTISLTFNITDTIKHVKDAIATQISFPANKQKVSLGTMFLKDECSLAYYNVNAQSVFSLGIKERGGRGRKN